MIVFLFINQSIFLLGQCTRLETWKGMPLKGWQEYGWQVDNGFYGELLFVIYLILWRYNINYKKQFLLGQCTRLETWKGMPLKGWQEYGWQVDNGFYGELLFVIYVISS